MIKEKIDLENLADYCIKKAITCGSTSCEVYVGSNVSETVNFRNRKIENSDRSDVLIINITTYIGNKKSSSSLTYIDKNNTDKMIEKCVDVTKLLPEDKYNVLPDKNLLATTSPDLLQFDNTEVNNQKKIEYLKHAEDAALSNKFIIKTNGSSFTQLKNNFVLANSLGFSFGFKKSEFTSYTDLVAKKNDSGMERDYEYDAKIYFKDLINPEELGNRAAKLAVRKLNPRKVKTQSIPVVFEKRISKNILNILSSSISGSSFARGTSFLKDKMNKEIFPENINVIDDPLIEKSLYSASFDSEGVKSKKINLITNGTLSSIILNTYYSKMLNINSNGRAGGLTNTYFESGKVSYNDLFKDFKNVLLITDIMGSFGNSITGDFSCGATGIYFENNENYPINNFTLAGKIEDIFKNIVLANDLEFKYAKNCPTALIKEGLVVGGV
jgi:PmbA protein